MAVLGGPIGLLEVIVVLFMEPHVLESSNIIIIVVVVDVVVVVIIATKCASE